MVGVTMPTSPNNESAKILLTGSNGAVVHLPGRHFPGVVIQGDSLANITRAVMDIRERVAKIAGQEESVGELDEVLEQLYARVALYETALEQHGMDLPYPKWSHE
jgi:hypothetical protein